MDPTNTHLYHTHFVNKANTLLISIQKEKLSICKLGRANSLHTRDYILVYRDDNLR